MAILLWSSAQTDIWTDWESNERGKYRDRSEDSYGDVEELEQIILDVCSCKCVCQGKCISPSVWKPTLKLKLVILQAIYIKGSSTSLQRLNAVNTLHMNLLDYDLSFLILVWLN